MSPGLVGAARLFAAFGAVAVDEEGWGAGCRVVDVAAGAASGGHDYVGVGFMDSLAFQRERDQFNHAIKLNPAIISCHVTSYNGLQPDRKPPHSFFHLRPRREAIIRIPYFHGVASPPELSILIRLEKECLPIKKPRRHNSRRLPGTMRAATALKFPDRPFGFLVECFEEGVQGNVS